MAVAVEVGEGVADEELAEAEAVEETRWAEMEVFPAVVEVAEGNWEVELMIFAALPCKFAAFVVDLDVVAVAAVVEVEVVHNLDIVGQVLVEALLEAVLALVLAGVVVVAYALQDHDEVVLEVHSEVDTWEDLAYKRNYWVVGEVAAAEERDLSSVFLEEDHFWTKDENQVAGYADVVAGGDVGRRHWELEGRPKVSGA